MIGIEDADDCPPRGQRVPVKLLDSIRRRISELTVNVNVAAVSATAENGAEYILLTVQRSFCSVNK